MVFKFARIISFALVLVSLSACESVGKSDRQFTPVVTAVSPTTPPLTSTLENTAVSQSSPIPITIASATAVSTLTPAIAAPATKELPFPEDSPPSEVATATPFPTAIPVTFPSYECPIDESFPAPTTLINDINVAYVGSDGIYYWQEATGQSSLLFASDDIEGLQISDDGQRIAFIQTDDVDTGRMSLWVMDSDGQNGRILLNEADFRALHGEGETVVVRPLNITWIPNSHTVAFSTVRYGIIDGYVEGITAHIYDDLNLIDVDSGDLTTLLPPGSGGNFAYSPDGTEIAIVNDSSLSLVNSDGSDLRPALVTWKPLGITHEYHRPQPAWMPDSRSLLIAPSNARDNIDALYNPNASSTIWQVWVDGTPPRQLSTMIGAPLWLGYSPDRRYVLFTRRIDDGLTYELHIATVDNNVHIIYATAEGMMGGGDWLPDGSGFIFGGHDIELQIGRLCQPPIPFLLPETPESFVRRREWVDNSRFLLTIDQPPQLLMSDLDGNVTLIGTLREEYFFSIGSLTAFDFSQ
jgi:Tol biopolymer transport system component